MSFANHNILDIALSIIPPTLVQARKSLGTKINRYGQSEAAYTEWVEVYGIVQPGSERNEHIEGMDYSKKYVSIWLRGYTLDGTHLDWSPDQIRYMGRIFNVIDVDDWYSYDNFRKCECVEVLNLAPNQRGAAKANSAKKKISRKKTVLPQGEASCESKPTTMASQETAQAVEEPKLFTENSSGKEETTIMESTKQEGKKDKPKARIKF